MLLVKENCHTGSNHGALWHIENEYDERGRKIGRVANFMGNVVCPDLQVYLAENPDVKIASSLPEGVTLR